VIRELAHAARHAPGTLALMRRMPQHELYETLIARADAAGLADRRGELVTGLRGRILEIGCGTGAMFRHYRHVTHVTALEPDDAFAARARVAAAEASADITVISGTAEAIPLPDGAVDAAVVALVLCSVASPEAVCRELARVVRPGGQVRLLEHVRSPRRLAGALMRLVDPLWLRLNRQGCHMDRDPVPALEGAGLVIDRVEPFQIWSAGIPAFPMRLVFATRR
jgi:SAM-dependent methyltransferase